MGGGGGGGGGGRCCPHDHGPPKRCAPAGGGGVTGASRRRRPACRALGSGSASESRSGVGARFGRRFGRPEGLLGRRIDGFGRPERGNRSGPGPPRHRDRRGLGRPESSFSVSIEWHKHKP